MSQIKDIGLTSTCDVKPQREPYVRAEMLQLKARANDLSSNIGLLKKRLEPVMAQIESCAEQSDSENPHNVPLAMEIRDVSTQIRTLDELIREILRRLEI